MSDKFVVFTPRTGRRLNDIAGAWPTRTSRGAGQYQPTVASKVLVVLTTELPPANKRVWNALEVFLDENGVDTTVAGGLVFDDTDPIYTVADASAEDVIMCVRQSRDTGPYWIGGAAGSRGLNQSPIRRAENLTEVTNSDLTGAYQELGRTDLGTFADEASLNLGAPTPSAGDFAFLTNPGTIWIVLNLEWVDSGHPNAGAAGISGTWEARISSAALAIGSIAVGQYISIVQPADGSSIWDASTSFPIIRG